MRILKTGMHLGYGPPDAAADGGRGSRQRFLSAVASILAASWIVGALVVPVSAQDGEAAPAQEAAPDEAPAAKPKPKPRPRAVPKPKPSEEAKPVETKSLEGKSQEGKSFEGKPAEAKPGVEGTVLEPAASDAPAAWPSGARTVSESYGDWTMNCAKEARVDCVVIQSQGDRRTGKRQFSFELRVPKDGRAEGLILMPFGLQIEPGVSFKLDDRGLGKGAPYSYCVADGCLVPISLPTLATDAMKTAQKLTVSATKQDATEPTVITVPLSGFAAAFARASAFGG